MSHDPAAAPDGTPVYVADESELEALERLVDDGGAP